MGGAAGHLSHLSEDLNLTFSDLKKILTLAAEGKLEKATEKLDGMNLVFTWNEEAGRLSAARSSGDIKRGGMDAEQLAAKFKDRGDVSDAFTSAFAVLRDAIGALSPKLRQRVFGDHGRRWFSMEVIYSSAPNIINYDKNSIVFHGLPTFEVDNGIVNSVDDEEAVDVLAKNIDIMQKAIQQRNWRISGPAIVNLKKLSSGNVIDHALGLIARAQDSARVGDDETLQGYLVSMARQDVEAMGVPKGLADDLALRVASAPGAPNVTQLKKRAGEGAKLIADIVASASERIKSYMEPIEAAIFELSLEVLKSVNSILVNSQAQELKRLKGEVAGAIKAIQASGNKTAMDILQAQMSRLGNIDRISSAVEGVVFIYKGKAYKFTGSFTPVHRILSLFKYGRNGIKLDKPANENRLREGGHSFKNTSSITLEDFNETLPHLKHDLEDLGATRIELVGSTGKKSVMGDIDLAVEFEGGFSELFDLATATFGKENVKKVGGSVVSVLYPIYSMGEETSERVQVDMMVGNVGYLSWARAGTSTIKSHPDFSATKGVVRNVLLNVINRFAAEKSFPGKTQELDRTRYNIDFDRGLFKVVQTKRGKDGARLKNWKTLKRDLITDDPDKIAQMMFGKGQKAAGLRSFEGVVGALRASSVLGDMADVILSTFVGEIHDLAQENPSMLGEDPKTTLKQIEQIAGE